MSKEELLYLQFQLKLEKSQGIIKPFVLCADGKLMGTEEAIQWIEEKVKVQL